jgi:hypothetical protein
MFRCDFRLAHALAKSFNFQGHVKKIFYVLTDDKVGAGPRLRPNALADTSVTEPTADQPMETDTSEVAVVDNSESTPQQPSLSAKLSALKRKAAEPADPGTSKARR